MNINQFTIKSQEALQQAQQIAQSYGQQQIENEHLFRAIFENIITIDFIQNQKKIVFDNFNISHFFGF